ncbi:MAG: FHA domain-containing protein [Candidatus Methylacidiphilales bacterium]|nr:FHA domain-containing protein [Candidatus Methylacidiphilales bacterium]
MTTLEILQLCLIGQRSGRIECFHPGKQGVLHVERGKIIHAVCGDAKPEDAFYNLVVEPGAAAEFIPCDDHPARTITTSTDYLLMEAARRADEFKRNTPVSPEPTHPPVTHLSVVSDPLPKIFELLDDRITIGRNPDNRLQLSVESVSGHHCVLEKRNHHYWINDLQSRNGTFLNNKPIVSPTIIQPGDLIQMGAALLRCEIKGPLEVGHKKKTARIVSSDTQDLRLPPRAHATEGAIRFQSPEP